jgi:hypothetical protein
MGRRRVEYGHEIFFAYRLYNNVTLLPGTRKFDGSSKGVNHILGMVFGFGKHRGTGRVEKHHLLSCERRARNYYTVTIAIATTITRRITITLRNGKIKHFVDILSLVERSVPPNAMRVYLTLGGGTKRGNRRTTPFAI